MIWCRFIYLFFLECDYHSVFLFFFG
uniref:Uncharacterized protein n=1 Tax=Rhizophora mucronata TaxID=61149 RepID=A0A2P2NID4_RHIMU